MSEFASVGEIARLRMTNQSLWGSPCDGPLSVLRKFGAMQAQEFAYAQWSVAQRTDPASKAAIQHEFSHGEIIRTHAMRPTWHFVLAEDIRWILQVTAPRISALSAYQFRKLELDGTVFKKSTAVLRRALRGGYQLTRTELAVNLERAGIAATGLRLGYIMLRAELDAILCSGALRGKQHTYALLEERAPHAKTMAHDEALAELTRRYFTSRGPATVKDYQTWACLTATEAKRGLAMVQSHLEHATVADRKYWFSSSSGVATSKAPKVDLIQCYDEYVMSYSESRDCIQAPVTAGALLTREADYLHAVLLNGHLIGRWRHAIQKKSALVHVSLYRQVKAAEQAALESAIERYGQFLGEPTKFVTVS